MPFVSMRQLLEHGAEIGYGLPAFMVNIDTDIRLAMTGAMRRHMAEKPSEFDPRNFMADAQKAAKGICKARYEAFGCAGQASKIMPMPLEQMAERYRKGELNPTVR